VGFPPVAKFLTRLRLTLEMIKFEHSVFALPFALTGALLAWRDDGFRREGLWLKLLWIVVAMVSARSVAMAFNRVLDADIDARNPRSRRPCSTDKRIAASSLRSSSS
jgi:4-hydroxybenzoate polyprenyltransferase